MTASLYDLKTKTAIDKQSNLTILLATLVGAAIGVVTTVGVAGNALGSGSTADGLRTISARPTNYTSDGIYYNGQYYSSLGELCYAPSPAAGMGGGASAPAPQAQATPGVVNAPAGGLGGGGTEQSGQPGGNVTVVKKLIGTTKNNTSVSLENTGPYSHNEVTTVNKTTTVVKNDNDVNVTNANEQQASSGDAKVIGNTNAGTAASGDAKNDNTTSTNVNISN